MADVLLGFLLTAGLYAIFLSYWLAPRALFPEFIEECSNQYQHHPVKSLFIGIAIAIPLMIIGSIFANLNHPLAKLIGVLFLLLPLFVGLCGSSGLCQLIGSGINSHWDETQPWRRVLRGGYILGLTFIFPLLGWFIIFPLTLLSGIGVFTKALWTRKHHRSTTPPPLPTSQITQPNVSV